MSNFENLLSKNFDQQEIVKLQERVDYAEVKAQIEQMQANKMLDNLEGRINKEVQDKRHSLEDRFNMFVESIKSNKMLAENKNIPIDKEEYIKERKSEIRDQFIEKISGDETTNITDKKTILGFGSLWAFEQIENGENIDKDANFLDKIITTVKAKFGFMVLNFLGYSDEYVKYKFDSKNIKLPVIENTQETNNDISNKEDFKYRAIINIFSKIFDRNSNDRAKYGEVFANQEFMKLSLNDLFEMKKNSYNNNTFNELITSSGHDKKDIKSAISILTQGKGYALIDNIYAKSNYTKENPGKDYRSLPISDIFNYMGRDLNVLDGMGNNTQLQSIAQGIKPDNINENTREYIKKKGLTLHLLSIAHDTTSYEFKGNKENIIDNIKTSYNTSNEEGVNQFKEEGPAINNIVEYGLDIQKNLFGSDSPFELYSTDDAWLASVGLTKPLPKISEIFSKDSLTLKEVIKLRVITGDKTNFTQMNGVQQAALYYEVAKILDTRKQHEISGVMLMTLIDVSMTGGVNCSKNAINMVPQNVRNIISQTTGAAVNSGSEYLEKLSQKIWGAFKDSPVKGVMAIGAFIPFFTDRYSLVDVATGK